MGIDDECIILLILCLHFDELKTTYYISAQNEYKYFSYIIINLTRSRFVTYIPKIFFSMMYVFVMISRNYLE